jgi:hypothetical protein
VLWESAREIVMVINICDALGGFVLRRGWWAACWWTWWSRFFKWRKHCEKEMMTCLTIKCFPGPGLNVQTVLSLPENFHFYNQFRVQQKIRFSPNQPTLFAPRCTIAIADTRIRIVFLILLLQQCMHLPFTPSRAVITVLSSQWAPATGTLAMIATSYKEFQIQQHHPCILSSTDPVNSTLAFMEIMWVIPPLFSKFLSWLIYSALPALSQDLHQHPIMSQKTCIRSYGDAPPKYQIAIMRQIFKSMM